MLTEGKLQATCSLEQHEKRRLVAFEPEPRGYRGHESSNERREEVALSCLLGLQQLMCLSEAANLEKKLNSLPSHFTWQDLRVSLSHITPGKVLL